MLAYLVGGAVRDQLLGLAVHERDWVVLDSTPQQMLAQGFKQVGADFPVFIHPETAEEYALARTERKKGKGYHGFEIHADVGVTIEEDLMRRDLTINAMAMTNDGTLIDPYGGQSDLDARLLRHVSPAFAEDPLRILRVARFVARFHHLGFKIADETMQLMLNMSASGELANLTPERVWAEFVKGMQTTNPRVFFETLRDCGALEVILPELDILFSIPQNTKSHPEGDVGTHTMLALTAMRKETDDPAELWATLCHDMGKGLTPPEDWPDHPKHATLGENLVARLCVRYALPKKVATLALIVTRWHGRIHAAKNLPPEAKLEVLQACDAWRQPERFLKVLHVCRADARGKLGTEQQDYPQAQFWQDWLEKCLQISAEPFIAQGLSGATLAMALTQARIEILRN
jgi:tRNA nucleotidyltransferase (CCA-adding enzyme)